MNITITKEDVKRIKKQDVLDFVSKLYDKAKKSKRKITQGTLFYSDWIKAGDFIPKYPITFGKDFRWKVKKRRTKKIQTAII